METRNSGDSSAPVKGAAGLRDKAARLREEVVTHRETAVLKQEQTAASEAKGHTDLVNQLRQANERLVVATMHAQTLSDAAEHANQLKEDFLAMLSHELRSPLAPIRNAAAILRRVTTTEPLLPWIHDVISRQVEHMTRLLDDLLDVARVNSGKMVLQQRPVAVSEFLLQAVEACRPLIDKRGQHLNFTIPTLPIYVDGDPVRLAQVFSNLLNNAAKYTQEGGAITLTAKPSDGATVVVSVTDNGSGIAPETLPHIFDLFVQADRSLAREGGLGIGLTVVRKLVELHGGRVECSSAGLNLGSEFVVTLPLLQRATPAIVPELSPAATSPLRRYQIVLIEDHVDANDSLAALLRMVGHDVMTAFDGVTGLALVRASRPQIVLCDIGLPAMDGYALLAQLREQMQDAMPVMIALTGYSRAEDRLRTLEAGFDHHLSKPVDMEALLRLIALEGARICAVAH